MSAAMMEVCGRYRDYYCFDSFKGLPPVTAEDGDLARAWQHDVNGERFFDNCRASLEQFKSTVARSGVENSRIHIVQGFFEKSLSSVVVPPILILRLDADWYQSTIVCLERFWDLVVTGGVIVIDDYHDWEGCRKAVHEFLARRKLNEAIEQTRFGRVVHIKKGVVSNAYARDKVIRGNRVQSHLNQHFCIRKLTASSRASSS